MSQNVGIVVISIASLFVSILTGPFMSKKVLKSFILMLHVSGFVLRLARVESVSPNPPSFVVKIWSLELQDFDAISSSGMLELDTSVSHGFPFSWCISLHWV